MKQLWSGTFLKVRQLRDNDIDETLLLVKVFVNSHPLGDGKPRLIGYKVVSELSNPEDTAVKIYNNWRKSGQ